MELVEVGPDLFAAMVPDTGWGAANSGFIHRDGGLVVDTMWDLPHTRRLIDLYATVSADPSRRVVNTHHNGDHCWGNQLFAETGAELIGHRLCAEHFTSEATPELLAALVESDPPPPSLAYFADSLRPYDFRGITLTPPTTLLDGDTTFDLDGLQVDVLFVGPAHTPGDVVVHVPEHGVVYAGDILFHRCTPLGWQGTYDHWLAALDRIAALEPAVIVPGHGPLATVEGLRDLQSYLRYVRDEAGAAHARGVPALEAAKAIELGSYAGWTQPERLAFQVHRAYRELDGAPWDEPFDAITVLAEVGELHDWYAERAEAPR